MRRAAQPQISTHPTLPENLAISTIARINEKLAGQSCTYRSSSITRHCPIPQFLIASRQLLEIRLTRSQQTRKLFLIGGFSACLADGTPLATQRSQLTTRAVSIASEIKSKTNGTCSKQTTKYISIASFCLLLAHARCFANPNPSTAAFLTATHPDSEIRQPHESKRETIFQPRHANPI